MNHLDGSSSEELCFWLHLRIYLPVDCVGCCRQVTIVERECQTLWLESMMRRSAPQWFFDQNLSLSLSHLVQSCGNPHGFETLCLKSFNVAVWIRTLEEPGNVQIGINESYFCFLFG